MASLVGSDNTLKNRALATAAVTPDSASPVGSALAPSRAGTDVMAEIVEQAILIWQTCGMPISAPAACPFRHGTGKRDGQAGRGCRRSPALLAPDRYEPATSAFRLV